MHACMIVCKYLLIYFQDFMINLRLIFSLYQKHFECSCWYLYVKSLWQDGYIKAPS